MSDINDQLWNTLQSDPAAKAAYEALTQAGGTVYIVGGAVRDTVLGGNPKDVDLMVGGLTGDQVAAALQTQGRVDYTGKQFGVYRLRTGDSEVEVALPRTEVSTGSGHTDFQVTADPYLTPEADLGRRDFTGNAMAFDTSTGQVLDPFGGQQDLQNGQLKLVNENAFRDDPLRIVRALVATARFGLEPDPALIQSMQEYADQIRHLPGERIQAEMTKLLSGTDPVRAIQLAFETGLIDYIAPELSAMEGFDQQNPHHNLTVDQHTLMVLKKMSELSNDPDMRLAALFHDSGKPDSFWLDPDAPEGGGGHFYKKVNPDGSTEGEDHDEVGANLAREFMTRLRYPNNRIERVVTLVRNHMFPYFTSEKGARRWLNSLGGDEQMAYDLLKLREADASGKRDGVMSEYDRESLNNCYQLLESVLGQSETATTIKDLAINGNDLKTIGIKPGPKMGEVLKRLLHFVLDDPSLNNRETLLELAQQYA